MPYSSSGSFQDSINRETGFVMSWFAKRLPADKLERPEVRESIRKVIHRRLSRRHADVQIEQIHVSFTH